MNLNWFMKFVFESETNKDKSTEIFPPLLLKPPMRSCNAASQKWSAKGSNFNEDERALLL